MTCGEAELRASSRGRSGPGAAPGTGGVRGAAAAARKPPREPRPRRARGLGRGVPRLAVCGTWPPRAAGLWRGGLSRGPRVGRHAHRRTAWWASPAPVHGSRRWAAPAGLWRRALSRGERVGSHPCPRPSGLVAPPWLWRRRAPAPGRGVARPSSPMVVRVGLRGAGAADGGSEAGCRGRGDAHSMAAGSPPAAMLWVAGAPGRGVGSVLRALRRPGFRRAD